MNAQVVTLVLGLALSQGAKRLDLDRPEILWPLRFFFVAVQAIVFGLYLYIAHRIRQKDDTTILKYVEPKPFGSQTGEPPAVITTTVRNYDLMETSKAIRGLVTGLAITGFMHFYMKFTQPLLVSGLTIWISLYRANIVRLHLRGQEGAEDLKRPFKGSAMFGQGGVVTDKHSIAEAERQNLKYKKEEF